ncbi:MAG: hypothetical protein JWP12_1348 [Bacteroidetes bacterium]|nr:hypothetical protein [Bacteroidota bacterium]
MKHIYIFLIAGIVLLASACNLINPAEPIPAYIHIEKIGLTTNPSLEGSNSSKITDAWVYMDGNLVGCFELPVTFPVIADNGMHNFVIKPGIKVNGIAATRAPYPFYNSYNTTISLTKGVVTTMSPMVTYVSNINWDASSMWKDDFEGGITTDTSPTPGVNTVIHQVLRSTDPGNVFEGNGSGIALLNNSDHTYCEVINKFPPTLYLPGGTSPVFLEMNYKCNYPFTVGLFAYSAATSVKISIINLHSTADQWNKVYIYVTPQISEASNPLYYNMFLGMLNTDNVPNPYFAVDNIKLVHFQ